MTITLPWSPSPNFTAGRPQQIQALVMHSVEGPMTAGLAKSLAGPNWFGSTVAGTSANAIFDQTGGIEMVKPSDRAWHVGNANGWTYGTEHCGYAAFSAAQWLTPAGKAMLTASAKWNHQIATEQGIPWRRLTQAEMRAGMRGLCTHNDCRVVWGGTTHTDPQWAPEVWDFYLAAAGAPATTTPPPTTGDVLDMTEDELLAIVRKGVKAELQAGLGNDYGPGKISSRSATKVRDMDFGTHGNEVHIISNSQKVQALLDHFGIKMPGEGK